MATKNLRNPTGYDGSPGTKTRQGIVRFATAAESAAGVLDNVAISPATAQSAVLLDFASPAAIGSTTPSAGTFTNLTVNDVFAMDGGAVTDFIGTATLVAGTVTIANTNIAAADRIFIQRIAANASTTMGELSYTISAAASFTINSLILGTPGSVQTGDLSTVAYHIIRQV